MYLCARGNTMSFIFVFCTYFSRQPCEAGIVITILEMRNLMWNDLPKVILFMHREARIQPSLTAQWMLFQINHTAELGFYLFPTYSMHHKFYVTTNEALVYKVQVVIPKGAFNSTTILLVGSLSVVFCCYIHHLKWCLHPLLTTKKSFFNEWLRLVTSF